MKRLRPYLPNSSSRMALVDLTQMPFDSYRPVHLTQIFGTTKWSISLIRYQSGEPFDVRPRDDIGLVTLSKPVIDAYWPLTLRPLVRTKDRTVAFTRYRTKQPFLLKTTPLPVEETTP